MKNFSDRMQRGLRLPALLAILLTLPIALSATTLTVTVPVDNVPGSLRQTIAAATSGDTITFGPATDGETMLLAGAITIDKSLVIVGLGPERTIISGASLFGVLVADLGTSGTLQIENLSIVDGADENGAGLRVVEGNLQMVGCVMSGNDASGNGGAIHTSSNGTVTISSSILSDNTAAGDAANQGGGAIYAAGGTLLINDSTQIIGNAATGTSGSGGGIFVADGATFIGNILTVRRNSAPRAGGGIEDASGPLTTTIIDDLTLDSNSTGPTPGNGGGLHVTGAGNIEIIGSLVFDNVAASEGGGLWNGSGTMTIRGGSITNNRAEGDAADNGGGGIFNNGGTLEISQNTIILANAASGERGSGGGIFNGDGGSLTIDVASIRRNTASRAGGGIEDASGSASTVTITDVLFEQNTTGPMPGNGGGLHVTGNGVVTINGGAAIGNMAASEGGGFWNGSGTMTITGTTIDGNVANGSDRSEGGGGLFNVGGTMEVIASTVVRNRTTGNGGGILADGGSVIVERSTISTNTAGPIGGGVAVLGGAAEDGDITIIASTITGNSSNEGSGAAALDEGNLRLSGSIVAGNSSSTMPGDLMVANNGEILSRDYNLIGVAGGELRAEANDKVGTVAAPVNALLGPLARNGGPTRTHALQCGSPAIDAGNPGNSANDQRDSAVFGGRRDIGAYEIQEDCGSGSVEMAGLDAALGSLYPVPSSDGQVTVEVPTIYGSDVEIRISAITTGETVMLLDAEAGTNRLDLAPLPAGTYLLRITGNNRSEGHKVVILR